MECDARTAGDLVLCEPREDENWFYRPRSSETAGAHYQEWLGWYLCDTDCLLCQQSCQFWCGVCVERVGTVRLIT